MTRREWLAATLAGVTFRGSANAALVEPGNVVTAVPRVNGTEFRLQSGAVCWVEFFSRDIVRIRISPSGRIGQTPSPGVSGEFPLISAATIFQETTVSIEAPAGRVVIDRAPFRIRAFRTDGSIVVEEKLRGTTWDTETTIFSSQFVLHDGESWHGGGFRGGPVNRRSRAFQFRNTAQAGYQDLTDPLNISIPFFMNLKDGKAGGILMNSPGTPFFDIGSAIPDTLILGAFEGEIDYFLFLGPTTQSILLDYHQLTGAPSMPPLWSLGFHQSRYGYKTQDEILSIASEFRQREIPCDSIHIDLDYMQSNNMFTWDSERFPDPSGLNSTLIEQGFHTVNILQAGLRTADPLYSEIEQMTGYLKRPDGAPYVSGSFVGDISWLDFTKPEVMQWYDTKLQGFLSNGTSGLWLDLNEPDDGFIPGDVTHQRNNRTVRHALVRNLYALDQVSLAHHSFLKFNPENRPWILSRGGWTGIHRYAANWSGDTASTWESLKTCIHTTVSMGISGQHQFGHDIGGFLDSPSQELFLRWIQFAAYTPLFRTHSVNTAAPREPWHFEEHYQTGITQAIRDHYQLLPFWYSVFERANRLSVPVIAPLFFHFPDDPQTIEVSDEFLIDGLILVAPVAEEQAETRVVYFPAGSDWFNFHTGEKYNGGTYQTISLSSDRIPVFVKDGAIIPYASVVPHTGLLHTAAIEWRIYGSADSSWTYYEDDGLTTAYQHGDFARAEVLRAENGRTFSITRQVGNRELVHRERSIRLLGRENAPGTIFLDGNPIPQDQAASGIVPSWSYDQQLKALTIRLGHGPAELKINVD